MAQNTQPEKNLYQQLKAIGVDEELAHQVDKSLSPEHVATKSDFLVMQEAILQVQLRGEDRYQELRTEMHQTRQEVHQIRQDFRVEIQQVQHNLQGNITALDNKIERTGAELRVEIAAMSRQFGITFFGLALTILSVFAVNWYFH